MPGEREKKKTHTIRIPSRRPSILPSLLRSTMNQKHNRILLLLSSHPPPRFQSPSLNPLLIRSHKVKLLSRTQSLLRQLGLRKPRHLLYITLALFSLGRFGVGILGEESGKVLDQEYVVGRREGWTREEETTWVQGIDAGRWACRRQLEWLAVEFVELGIGTGLGRCWRYGEVKDLDLGLVTRRKIDERSFQVELETNRCHRLGQRAKNFGRTYSELARWAVPMLGQSVPHVLVQVVDHDLGSITLIAILIKLQPCDFVALLGEHGAMDCSLFSWSQLAWLSSTHDVREVDLVVQYEQMDQKWIWV